MSSGSNSSFRVQVGGFGGGAGTGGVQRPVVGLAAVPVGPPPPAPRLYPPVGAPGVAPISRPVSVGSCGDCVGGASGSGVPGR